MAASCRLVTIPISHFCEKARWALDRAGVPYEERAHLQLLHRVAVKHAGGGRTAPVLRCADGTVLADSADIVRWADARAPEDRKLYPAEDGAETEEIRALERDWDRCLGPHGRRWMYFGISGQRDIAVRYGTAGVPGWQRRAFPLAYPMVTGVIDHYLDITPETAAESKREVRASFDVVASRLSDGRPFLVGERFSAADLTFSALAAAVLMPPEYGVQLPQPEELPAAMGEAVREFREHPAGAHAMAMFREHRR